MKRKLFLNTSWGLIYQILTILSGFIIPRYILKTFGSDVNGLVTSITQFLGFITLCECGLGSVIQSSLYKPLAQKNTEEVSKVIKSSTLFFRKIAYILIVYIFLLVLFYPNIVIKQYSFWFTASLILIISISSLAQYYFSMSYRLLLAADQLSYIYLSVQCFTLLLNTIFTVILVNIGASIQIVKLASSLVFLIQPVFLNFYVKKHYELNLNIQYSEEPIKQKWNGLYQHIASTVTNYTDTIVLTLFSTLANVSIYNIYYLVVNGLRSLILSLQTGVQALLGNLYALQKFNDLDRAFSRFEWLMHTIVIVIFSCAGILIVPFVKVYTNNIVDINYIEPLFGFLLVWAQGIYCLRLPYNTMVLAAGHYRQTQNSALIEAGLNIVISILFVKFFGLVGVAIGTLVAMSYRTIYLAWYLSTEILKRNIKYFIKHIFVDLIIVIIAFYATCNISLTSITYFAWLLLALKCFIINLGISLVINYLFYPQELINEVKNKLFRG